MTGRRDQNQIRKNILSQPRIIDLKHGWTKFETNFQIFLLRESIHIECFYLKLESDCLTMVNFTNILFRVEMRDCSCLETMIDFGCIIRIEVCEDWASSTQTKKAKHQIKNCSKEGKDVKMKWCPPWCILAGPCCDSNVCVHICFCTLVYIPASLSKILLFHLFGTSHRHSPETKYGETNASCAQPSIGCVLLLDLFRSCVSFSSNHSLSVALVQSSFA